MFFSPLKQSVSRLRINSSTRLFLPSLCYVNGQSRNSSFSVKNVSAQRFGLSISCKQLYLCRAVRKDPSRKYTSDVDESGEGIKSDLAAKGDVDSEDNEVTQRVKKTIHGNKGRVPWNKGIKHSEETRERISRRTREALKDPKVRKKMSEAPRVLSKQTKVKIRAALTKLWGRRLRLKRSREEFLQLWSESIALAAKKGGADQQELEWDTYEKFNEEVARQVAEEAKRKKLSRIRKEREAKVKAALKMARIAQKKREWEENAQARQQSMKKRNRWSKEEKEKLVEFQEEKLKERLMKIQRKKSVISQVSTQHQRTWEKFDLDLEKGKHLQKDISLADQIRFANKRRAELLLDKLQDFILPL